MALSYCKCGCGQLVESTVSYSIKLPTNKKIYFVNADHYGKWKENASVKKTKIDEKEFYPVFDLITDIIGMKLDTKTMAWKYYEEWKKNNGKDKILYYLRAEKWNLQKVFKNKNISTAYACLQYLNGIIKNNLEGYKIPEEEVAPKQDDMDVVENTNAYINTKRKKSLAELEEEAEC